MGIAKDFSKLLDCKLTLSITIKPGILNIAIAAVEMIIKVVLFPIFMIIVILIDVLMIVLEIAIAICEGAQKALKYLEKALAVFKRQLMAKLDKKSAGEKVYQKMEWQKAYLSFFYADNGNYCQKKIKTVGGNACFTIDGTKMCSLELLKGREFPKDCGWVKDWAKRAADKLVRHGID